MRNLVLTAACCGLLAWMTLLFFDPSTKPVSSETIEASGRTLRDGRLNDWASEDTRSWPVRHPAISGLIAGTLVFVAGSVLIVAPPAERRSGD